jgi:hypothetical protein
MDLISYCKKKMNLFDFRAIITAAVTMVPVPQTGTHIIIAIRESLEASFQPLALYLTNKSNGSYYYSNPNGSTYYNDGAGSARYNSGGS